MPFTIRIGAKTFITVVLNERGINSFDRLMYVQRNRRQVFFINQVKTGELGDIILRGHFVFDRYVSLDELLSQEDGSIVELHYNKDDHVAGYVNLSKKEIEDTKRMVSTLRSVHPSRDNELEDMLSVLANI